MSNTDEKLEELFPFYALGTLSDSERAQVEAYAASNLEAQSRLDEMLRAASAIAFSAEPMEPSAELKARVMGRVRADAGAQSGSARLSRSPSRARAGEAGMAGGGTRWAYAFAVASLLLAAVLGVWGLSVNNEVALLKAQVAALQQEVENQKTVLVELSSPNAEAFAISGTEHQPQAQGHMIADAKTGSAVLVVSGLKPLEAVNTYEFWLINDSGAFPAGLFKVNSEGLGVLQVTRDFDPGTYNAIGVSIEPQDGSEAPTGDIVMLGKLTE